MKKRLVLLSLVISILLGCSSKDEDYIPITEAQYEEGEELLTGTLGVNSNSANAFGFEIPGLTFQEQAQFATGNSLFNQSWVASPASTTARDGLGPTFNARSCAGCHFKDGRGEPLINGETSSGFLIRVSQLGQSINGGPLALPSYGTQIQDRSNNGIASESNVTVTYETISGTYADGNIYELQKPTYSFSNEQFGSLAGVETSPRVAQQTIGMGLISALPDSQILQHEDELDTDGDGISGKANYVWNTETNATELGKYGWKANTPTLKTQVAGAFHGDMGLTTSVFAENNCPSPQQDCLDAPNGGEPEVTDDQLERVVFYQSTLSVPNRRNAEEQNVLEGKVLFNELACITCHAIDQITGTSEIHTLLENITIKPYSDFLLHDMGDALADNRADFLATGNEWRTQPLWGIGLISTVNGHTFLLHDGRARNIEEAILWHGGEAEKSKTDFTKLDATQREQLIAFINSL